MSRTKSSPKLFEKKRSAKKQADYFITQANRIAMVPNNNTVFFIPGVEVKVNWLEFIVLVHFLFSVHFCLGGHFHEQS